MTDGDEFEEITSESLSERALMRSTEGEDDVIQTRLQLVNLQAGKTALSTRGTTRSPAWRSVAPCWM